MGGRRSLLEEAHNGFVERLGGIGAQVCEALAKATGKETLSVVLGHLQRGGAPTSFDRVLATRFGGKAVELVRKGEFGTMVALQGQDILQVPLSEAVHNVGHASLLVLGLVQGDWDLVAEGLHDKLHQPRRSPLYPQSMALLRRAQELGALGATISGAGPTILFWTHYDATGAVMARLKPATAGWAAVMHASFEPQGAFVREL